MKTFKLSNDKRFVETVQDIVGLYLDPPDKALVFSVDEKSQIQVLDRTQPGLPLKKGRCGTMEVGLGHYEGRGWRGFHQHATLCVSLRIPDLREGDDSPLRTCQRPETLAIYPSRRLPTQRICRYDHNATSRTQSPRCVSVSREHCCWPCRGAPIAAGHRRARSSRTSDAVGLMLLRAMPELPRLSAPHEVLALSSGPHTHLTCSPTQIGLMPHHSELQRLRR